MTSLPSDLTAIMAASPGQHTQQRGSAHPKQVPRAGPPAPATTIVKPHDGNWARLRNHLLNSAHLEDQHLELVSEVWYTRNPAGGGLKCASWLFKMRDGRQFTTQDEAITYMRKQLQEPAALTGTTAAAAAQHRAPAPTQDQAAAAAKQGVRPAAAACEQPPAKKHCTTKCAGGSAAVAAAAAALKQPRQAVQGAQGQQQGVADRAPRSNAAANAGKAAVAAGGRQQTSNVILTASGALLRSFPHSITTRNRGPAPSPAATPATAQGSRLPSAAVLGQQQQQQQGGRRGAQGCGHLARPELVYDVRRPNKLDLQTALSVTAVEYMDWLVATGAEDLPADGEELVASLLDGEHPVVRVLGIPAANFAEIRDLQPAVFEPIVQGRRKHAGPGAAAGGAQPPERCHQKLHAAAAAAAAAVAGKAAAAAEAAAQDSSQQEGWRVSDSTLGSDSSDATASGRAHTSAGAGVSPPVAALPLPADGEGAAACGAGTTAAPAPTCLPSPSTTTSGCMQPPAVLAAAAAAAAAAAVHKPASNLPSRLGPPQQAHLPASTTPAAGAGTGGAGLQVAVGPRRSDCGSASTTPSCWEGREAESACGMTYDACQQLPGAASGVAQPAAAAAAGPSHTQLQRRDPRAALLAAASPPSLSPGLSTGAGVPGGAVGGTAAAAVAAAAAAAGRESGQAPAAAAAAAGAAAPAGPAGASALSSGASSSLPTREALQAQLDRVRQERDAAIELCRRYHQQMVAGAHIFGLLGLAHGGEEEEGGGGQA